MLLSGSSNTIGEGDLVILYFSPMDMHPITITPSEAFQHRLGRFPHSAFLSLPFGSRILATNNTTYAYALRPTTDLWTRVLPHRTQIIYHADVAFIIQKLGIREGCVVVESGTGSGSFTHSLARAVAPSGKVHTFDFHEQRATLIR
jgi:tRNA (adenine57-N1/adenine58-N1)-methyltransferase